MKVIKRRPDQGYLDRWLWAPKVYVNVNAVKSSLTHTVADSYTGREKLLYLWKETEDHILVPRAFWDPMRLPFPVVDCRPRVFPTIEFSHRIQLDHRPTLVGNAVRLAPTGDTVQQLSVEALKCSTGGVLTLACGKGKTVVALYEIALSKVPALVLCDNTNLLQQWVKEIEKLLDVPGGIGIFGGGKHEWKKGLVIATYQSVANWADTIEEEARRWFGRIYWDEGHHVSAPVFARTADMFYGKRLSLTATPSRDDGLHIISDVHIGPVLHKDLTPTMVPRFAFLWTGLEIDLKNPTVAPQVLGSNGQVHISKVYGYFGQWLARLSIILDIVARAYRNGRMTLVLSNSVDEVVNLMALWERGNAAVGNLYSDIAIPTPQELGETLQPEQLNPKNLNKLKVKRAKLLGQIERVVKKEGTLLHQAQLQALNDAIINEKNKMGAHPTEKRQRKFERFYEDNLKQKELLFEDFDAVVTSKDYDFLAADLTQVNQSLRKHDVHQKIQNELARRQRQYILDLVEASQSSGLLTYDVPPKTREKMLSTRNIIFSVTKYGKEGMDCPRLDTVILSSLFSSRNGLQQLLGRPTRPTPGKKDPTLIALVDTVGQCIGMSKKLIGHLRDWPREEGGPYNPILLGYPDTWMTRNQPIQTMMDLLGQ